MTTDSFKPLFNTIQATLADAPNQAVAIFSANSEQVAGLRSEIRIRDFQLVVDEPEALGGTDAGPNPVEIALASLATCQEITYRLYADKLGIPLDHVSVSVEGDVDLRGLFAVDEAVRPGFQAIRATVKLESPAGQAAINELVEAVNRHCPVLDLLQNRTPVTIDVQQSAAVVAAE